MSYPLVHTFDPSTIATYHFRPSHGVGAGLDSGVLFGGGLGSGRDSLVGSKVTRVGVGGIGGKDSLVGTGVTRVGVGGVGVGGVGVLFGGGLGNGIDSFVGSGVTRVGVGGVGVGGDSIHTSRYAHAPLSNSAYSQHSSRLSKIISPLLSYPLVHSFDPTMIVTYHFRPSHGVGAGLGSGVLSTSFGAGLGRGIDSFVGTGVTWVGVGGVGVGGVGVGAVGCGVTTSTGENVGSSVGDTVHEGLGVGFSVGAGLGSSVRMGGGFKVGSSVGLGLGLGVGSSVGLSVGASVGLHTSITLQ